MGGLLGIDLDNTIIDYSAAYAQIAAQVGLPSTVRDRRSVREFLRSSQSGDDEWQRFQAVLYTEGLHVAVPAQGVINFLDEARALGWDLTIVSHKTKRTQKRFGGLPLREAAVRWLTHNQVVPQRCGSDLLHFEATQQRKMDRIRSLRCDIFVDDLESIVFHRDRPPLTQMVHYVPGSTWIPGQHWGVAGRGDFASISAWLRQC